MDNILLARWEDVKKSSKVEKKQCKALETKTE